VYFLHKVVTFNMNIKKTFTESIMKKKSVKVPKARNWLAMHAKGLTGRRGGGVHRCKKTYTRKAKHKNKKNW